MASAAVCAACGGAQPADWKAGDLCAHCGQASRREVRCYWCAKATPVAKFCRSCGAAVVEDRLYGAARMLKEAGTDRFTIPRLLGELDPDQIENFSRIYQRHAMAVSRHADELRFLERFLRQKHWSASLEDELIPQLPWPEATLANYSTPPLPAGDDLATARAIQTSSPLPLARALAALVRLRLGDWDAYPQALEGFRSNNDALRAEAVLLLSSWRTRHAVQRQEDPRKFIEELKRSPFKTEAAVALAALSREPVELPAEAVDSADRDVALGAALVRGDVDRLCAALRGDPLERLAAGCALARLGVFAPLEATLREGPDDLRAALIYTLSNSKQAAPELGGVLLELVDTTPDETLRERAVRILCRACPPGALLRLAKAARGSRSIYQTLLQTASPEGQVELADFLLDQGAFTMTQYGLKEAALPDSYVPSRFARADEKTKVQLLSFAEGQLEKRGDEDLHRFVLQTYLGPPPASVRTAACWVLRRWYRHQGDHRQAGPFKLEREALQRYAGPDFVLRLAAVLRDRDTLKEVGVFDSLADLFSSADLLGLEDLCADEAAAHDLVRAALQAVRGDYWPGLIDSLIQFLGQIGTKALWRDEVIAGLEALGKKGNYHYDKALRGLRLAAHGLPDEDIWNVLPDDLVPERYPAAPLETRNHLLRLAELQLRERRDSGLLRFLLEAAFSEGDDGQRIEALRLYTEFSKDSGPVPVSAAAVESVLRHPVLSTEQRFLRFLERHFEKAAPASLHALAPAMQDYVRRSPNNALGRELARVLKILHPAEEPAPPEPVPQPQPENPYVEKGRLAQRMGEELQAAILKIMSGSDSPEDKMRQATQLSTDYQARIQDLYKS